jgi:hypothetical protein
LAGAICQRPSAHRDEFQLGKPTHHKLESRFRLRSNLVYSAALKIENRFLLSATVMRAVQKLHLNSTRTEDTINRVFSEVAVGHYTDVKLPEVVPPPAIDALMVASLAS